MPPMDASHSPQRLTGLLGGTFNPVHRGHLSIAREAMRLFRLEEVWFIPCGVPPHKPAAGLAPNHDRLAMLELAIADEPRFKALSLEFDRAGPSYSLDTITELQEAHPDRTFVFIIGADTLPELHTWHRPLDILERIRMVTLARPGFVPDPEAIQLPPPWPERLLADLQTGSPVDAASREIRMELAAGRTSPLVPDSVIRYIQEHNLYL